MSNIREEFRRFTAFAATDKGFRAIESAWLKGLNRSKSVDKRWYRPWDKCLSFAIDDRRGTWDFEIGELNEDHIHSAIRLIHRLQEKTGEDFIDYKWLTRGYLQNISGWIHPIVFIPQWHIHPQITLVEEKILELGVGLPTSPLLRARFPHLVQRAP